jgi:hypothetical protein
MGQALAMRMLGLAWVIVQQIPVSYGIKID